LLFSRTSLHDPGDGKNIDDDDDDDDDEIAYFTVR